jgi:transcriptional regulator NrdR family protein
MIRCPRCNHFKSEILGNAWDLHENEHDYKRRNRRCLSCRRVFHTREYPETTAVVKPYDRLKERRDRWTITLLERALKRLKEKPD